MGERIYLNNDWGFTENYSKELLERDFDESRLTKVRLPHTCKETPFHYFDEHIYQMVSGYRKIVKIPQNQKGKKILLTIDGAAHESEVFLNGEKVGEHHCGYTAFSMDLSEKLNYGKDNVLVVKVDSREDRNIPPFGFVIDYMTYGGIYRDVYLEIHNLNYLQDVFVRSDVEIGEKIKAEMISEITLNKISEQSSKEMLKESQDKFYICQYLKKKNETEYKLLGQVPILEIKKEIKFSVDGISLWDTEHPVLYEIKTQLLKNNEILDEKIVTTGFRKIRFQTDGFYLNDKKVKLRGLNRHQSYPYVGYAMPESVQKMDADILKKELGLNAVRTSHYPQSHYFLDRCDEIGLLVFTEMPGWQHIGDEAWKNQAVDNVRDMILQYRNHISIILWGVRINESKDDDEFYRKTNQIAHELDSSRPTGGVRAHKKSSMLEDVYTYNDFLHDGKARGCHKKSEVTSAPEKAYLISEYNGHMYPTKSFDGEEHRVEHAIRHAKVLDAVWGQEDIAGSFGWCMFDYNTHKDFGSGDRICYHGVMDMFRNPKLAADVYACEQEENIVLSLSSTMDIGEHPGSNRGNTYIFTNADSVRMYKNERFIKEYKKENSPYKNMNHGPILIDDFIGDAIEKDENFKPSQAKKIKEALNTTARYGFSNLPKSAYLSVVKLLIVYRMSFSQAVELYSKYIGDWGGSSTKYRFEAIKDKKIVKTITKEPMKVVHLGIQADYRDLTEKNSYDVAAVRIRTLDENENLLNFYNGPVLLETEGPIEIIGPKVISMQGGMGGAYIKTIGESGAALLKIKNDQAEDVEIGFTVTVDTKEKDN